MHVECTQYIQCIAHAYLPFLKATEYEYTCTKPEVKGTSVM